MPRESFSNDRAFWDAVQAETNALAYLPEVESDEEAIESQNSSSYHQTQIQIRRMFEYLFIQLA